MRPIRVDPLERARSIVLNAMLRESDAHRRDCERRRRYRDCAIIAWIVVSVAVLAWFVYGQ